MPIEDIQSKRQLQEFIQGTQKPGLPFDIKHLKSALKAIQDQIASGTIAPPPPVPPVTSSSGPGLTAGSTPGTNASLLNSWMASEASSNGFVSLSWPDGIYTFEASIVPPVGVPVAWIGSSSQSVTLMRSGNFPLLSFHGSGSNWAQPLFKGIGFQEWTGGAQPSTLVEMWQVLDGIIEDIRAEGCYNAVGLHLREWFNCWADQLRHYFTAGMLLDGFGPNAGCNGVQFGHLYFLDNKGTSLKLTGDGSNTSGSQCTNITINDILAEEGTGLNATTAPVLDFDFCQDIDVAQAVIQIGSARSGMTAPIRMAGASAGPRPVRIKAIVDYVQSLATPPLIDIDHQVGTMEESLRSITSFAGHPSFAHVRVGNGIDHSGHTMLRRPSTSGLPVINDLRDPPLGVGSGGRLQDIGRGFFDLLPPFLADPPINTNANCIGWDFDPNTNQHIETMALVPPDCLPGGSLATFRLVWTASTNTAGNVAWQAQSAGSYWTGPSGSTNAPQSIYNATASFPAASQDFAQLIDIPGPTIRPNETLHIELWRDAVQAFDTLGVAARLISFQIAYDTDW